MAFWIGTPVSFFILLSFLYVAGANLIVTGTRFSAMAFSLQATKVRHLVRRCQEISLDTMWWQVLPSTLQS